MRSSIFVPFVLLNALALVGAVPVTTDSLDEAMSLVGRSDNVILSKRGSYEVVSSDELLQYLEAQGISLEPPPIDYDFLNFTYTGETDFDGNITKRSGSCTWDTVYVTDVTQTFVDWDVQMSPVVLGVGDGISVAISSGWSVANAVTVSAGFTATLIEDFLQMTLSTDYTKTWTTTQSSTYTATVKGGEAGTWVTRPWVTRKYGRTFKGCPGSYELQATWMADAHEEGSYDQASWVSGFITACIKAAPTDGKMTRCSGGGYFQ